MEPLQKSTQAPRLNRHKRYFKARVRRQKENQSQTTTINPIKTAPKQTSHIDDQVKQRSANQLSQQDERQRRRDRLPPVLEDDDVSFPQAIQARASEIDDDPQMTEIYWYGFGAFQSDTDAVLNCHW